MDWRVLDRVDRNSFDQVFEPFGQRGLAAPDRSEKVQDLFFFLKPLRCVAEIGNDVLDGLLHAEQVAKARVAPEYLVGKYAR